MDPGDVILDKYLGDINLIIDDDGLGAKSISSEAMAYLYAGTDVYPSVNEGITE